jgi:hypothetical protein
MHQACVICTSCPAKCVFMASKHRSALSNVIFLRRVIPTGRTHAFKGLPLFSRLRFELPTLLLIFQCYWTGKMDTKLTWQRKRFRNLSDGAGYLNKKSEWFKKCYMAFFLGENVCMEIWNSTRELSARANLGGIGAVTVCGIVVVVNLQRGTQKTRFLNLIKYSIISFWITTLR